MKITLYDSQDDLIISNDSVNLLVNEVCKELDIDSDEIIINFITSQKMQDLHEEFFNDPSETDCITFPIDGKSRQSDNYHIIGEVFVCPKVAIDTMPDSPYQEASLYLIHTILHLIGYEDTDDNLKSIMELKQFNLLDIIKSKNLLLTK
jgi:probable rRNA maturation factor